MPRSPRPFPDDSEAFNTSQADQLEARLSVVLEREGVTISVAPPPRRRPQTQNPAFFIDRPPEPSAHPIDVSLAREASAAYRQRIPRPINIQHGEHEQSPYIIRLEGVVGKPRIEHREGFGSTMHRWQAPSQVMPSLESVCAQAGDLWIEMLDPVYFHDQFTPGAADQAFREQYRWWSRLRAPFIRWQHQSREQEQGDGVGVTSEAQFEELLFAEVEEEQAQQEMPITVMPEAVFEEQQEVPAQTEQTPEAAWNAPYLTPHVSVRRVMIGFFAVFALVMLPAGLVTLARAVGITLKHIQGTTEQALASAQNALNSTGQSQQIAFRQAADGFRQASDALAQLNTFALGTAHAIPQTRGTVKVAEQLLQVGEESARAGKLLSQGWERVFADDVTYPDERLQRLLTYIGQAKPHLDVALQTLDIVDTTAVPQKYRDQINTMQTTIREHQSVLLQMEGLMTQLLPMIGHDQSRTYLLVFQNNAELRPSGGFMGSIAEITVDRGRLTKINVPGGGPYDLRSQLTTRVAPPGPLQLVGSRWEFQDANWFPDFPETAEKIRWFWSKSNQPTIDGVMAVNASVLPKLLTITGPIELKEAGKTVTADSVLDELQKAVELDYDKSENKPKKIIGQLMAPLLEKIMSSDHEQWLKISEIMANSLENKDIQVTLFHPEEQATMDAFGWTGRWPQAFGDTVAVVGANIAGQKSDAVISETVDHEAAIDEQGFITDTLTLTRIHNGQKGTLFNGVNNVEYVRIYVPQGATLLNASGFSAPNASLFETLDSASAADAVSTTARQVSATETVDISEENGRTVFGGWLQLKPGQRSVTRFRYRLPFTTFDLARRLASVSGMSDELASTDGAYITQRISQSGKERAWNATVVVPSAWSIKRTPAQAKRLSGRVNEAIPALTQDQTRVVLFSSQHDSTSETP